MVLLCSPDRRRRCPPPHPHVFGGGGEALQLVKEALQVCQLALCPRGGGAIAVCSVGPGQGIPSISSMAHRSLSPIPICKIMCSQCISLISMRAGKVGDVAPVSCGTGWREGGGMPWPRRNGRGGRGALPHPPLPVHHCPARGPV